MQLAGEILYVLSDVRSGSTLLDQLLSAHPDVVSVGELHWLPAYIRQDRRLYNPVHPLVCACGKTVLDCAFWESVRTEARCPLENLRYRPRFSMWMGRGSDERSRLKRIKHWPMRMLRKVPSAYTNPFVHHIFGGNQLARDSIFLANSILRATNKRILVDSSKSVFKFWSAYQFEPAKVKTVVLTRDYRAVAHSKMRRGETLDDAVLGWRMKMMEIQALTATLGEGQCHKLKYESLCLNPDDEMRRLCEFLAIGFNPAMLARPTANNHNIGGSPSKFDPSKREISLDTGFQSAFDEAELSRMRSLVGDIAASWGY